jgi:hypothetical protein
MNSEKAREYFSAYAEGALDPGLVQALERKLAADAALRDEYRSFAALWQELESLKAPVPEPEFDLHERISRRLDLRVWEQSRAASASPIRWWRSLALGGLATLAIVAALTQIPSNGTVSSAGVVDVGSTGHVTVAYEGSELVLRYRSQGEQRLRVVTSDGEVRLDRRLSGETLRSVLENRRDHSALLTVTIEGTSESAVVVVPGARPAHKLNGVGTVHDLALAASDHFRVALVLQNVPATHRVAWSFASANAYEAVRDALADVPVSVDARGNGIIGIVGD